MDITPTPRRPADHGAVNGAASDADLRDLEIEGYRIEFSRRVALLPVELTEPPPGGGRDG